MCIYRYIYICPGIMCIYVYVYIHMYIHITNKTICSKNSFNFYEHKRRKHLTQPNGDLRNQKLTQRMMFQLRPESQIELLRWRRTGWEEASEQREQHDCVSDCEMMWVSVGSMGSLSRSRLSDFAFTFHFHALEKEMCSCLENSPVSLPGESQGGGA